ncbi:GNAT family N-acyltransferase [Brucella abortus]|nr:GNAT family N-acyltransferase [Brucella abortus]
MTALLGMGQQIIDDTVMSGLEAQQALFASNGDAIILGRIGSLEVRLANSRAAIQAAQELRFRVFFEEMGARKETIEAVEQRDADRFDTICDHLLVYDTAPPVPEHQQIVGTYRLMRNEQAEKALGFYSADEYDVQRPQTVAPQPSPAGTRPFLRETGISFQAHRRAFVAGRMGLLPPTLHRRDVRLCLFHGAVPAAHALGLSFLHHNCRATDDWDVRALPHRYQAMDLMPKEAINNQSCAFSMPPLVKGYLRLGAMIGMAP